MDSDCFQMEVFVLFVPFSALSLHIGYVYWADN